MAAALLSNLSVSSLFFGQQLVSITAQIETIPGGNRPCCFRFWSPRCAEDTPYEGCISRFPQINNWDPHKRLRLSSDAAEEEAWSARNFLLSQYQSHERSAESVEPAFEKLLMTSFKNRKRTKDQLRNQLEDG